MWTFHYIGGHLFELEFEKRIKKSRTRKMHDEYYRAMNGRSAAPVFTLYFTSFSFAMIINNSNHSQKQNAVSTSLKMVVVFICLRRIVYVCVWIRNETDGRWVYICFCHLDEQETKIAGHSIYLYCYWSRFPWLFSIFQMSAIRFSDDDEAIQA